MNYLKLLDPRKAFSAAGSAVQYAINSRYGDLFKSIELKNFPRVKKLISEHPESLTQDEEGATPLSFACEIDATEIALYLISQLKSNFDINRYCALVSNRNLPIHEQLENKYTPLQIACTKSNTAIASLLIKKGADLNVRDYLTNMTPLIIACKNGNEEIAIELINAGADIYWVANDGTRASLESQEQNMTKVNELLIKKNGSPDFSGRENTSILFALIGDYNSDNDDTIMDLLTQNIDLTYTPQVTCDNQPILNYTLDRSRHTFLGHIARRLIERIVNLTGAKRDGLKESIINAVSPLNRYTPFLYASENGMTAILKLLKANGANVNYKVAGTSALKLAENYPYTTAYLITQRAFNDPKPTSSAMNTAASTAQVVVDEGNSALISAYDSNNSDEVVRLIKEGVDPNIIFSKVCAGYPSIYGDYILNSCIKYGANVNLLDTDGQPLLMLLKISESNKTYLSRLIECGADINAINKNGTTPLLSACTRTDLAREDLEESKKENLRDDMLFQMISLGANVDKKDNYGKNLYDYCESPIIIHYIDSLGKKLPPAHEVWDKYFYFVRTNTTVTREILIKILSDRPRVAPPLAYVKFNRSIPNIDASRLPAELIASLVHSGGYVRNTRKRCTKRKHGTKRKGHRWQ
jgi:ankyrin repeat protein